MASHGVSRGSGDKPTTGQERRREQQKIDDYRGLVDSVNTKIRDHYYSNETLGLASKLLKWNPEYYTIWNHRRLLMQNLILPVNHAENVGGADRKTINGRVADELVFLLPLLRKFPKCYWIWNYRLWLLQESSHILQATEARNLWQQELMLASKMLSLDSRNFMGWGYRRTVVAALETLESATDSSPTTLTEQEFEYTTKMINTNLSNFSAWHNRSKLIPRLLDERKADHGARRKFLDQELELIQRALWAGSEDQSLWFYHQYLISTFDPKYSAKSMAPDLTTQEKSEYIAQEIDRILEMLDVAEDCKWVYQALIHVCTVYRAVNGHWPAQAQSVEEWADKLAELDPLRAGRWLDLKKNLNST